MVETLKAIGLYLGPDVSPRRVRSLARNGAPIRVIGRGTGARYLADSDALAAWVRCERDGVPVHSPPGRRARRR